jgi:hypothetical protein
MVGGLLFVMPYMLRVSFAVLPFTPVMDSPNFLYALSGLLSFLVILFSEVWSYVLISVAVGGLVLMALRWGQSGRVTRGVLVLTLLAILVFPWFFRYEPAVAAAPGYTLRWPTEPTLLAGVAKRAQIVTEQRPHVCLMGWSANASLYYQATCNNGLDQTWAYNPNTSMSTLQVTTAPTDLSIVFERIRKCLIWASYTIHPPEAEPSTRSSASAITAWLRPMVGGSPSSLATSTGQRMIVVSSAPIDHK